MCVCVCVCVCVTKCHNNMSLCMDLYRHAESVCCAVFLVNKTHIKDRSIYVNMNVRRKGLDFIKNKWQVMTKIKQ